ncbi:MAG TPA: TetR/AcrR family transcriptional regulator [Verrucomicrobiae bacterium]|jgi:AcrR family transcriptional regulator|nr:TetR/AcrR family transcriptional regulator [Verrucomicrobiae bacterium]
MKKPGMLPLRKTSGPGRRERRRAETREKLYRAAMELFAERGFFDTSTEAITEAADVGQGTFFNYFPTKQHVLMVLSEKQIGKVNQALEEAQAGGRSAHDVLQRLIHAIAEEPTKSAPLTRSLLATFVTSDDVRQFTGETMARGRKTLAKIIKLGQERGEIRSDRRPVELAMTFQRSVLGTLLLWSIRPHGEVAPWLERTFQDFWDVATARGERSK